MLFVFLSNANWEVAFLKKAGFALHQNFIVLLIHNGFFE